MKKILALLLILVTVSLLVTGCADVEPEIVDEEGEEAVDDETEPSLEEDVDFEALDEDVGDVI